MAKIGIFYGSSTGNTEKVAELIRQGFGGDAVTINVEDASMKDIEKFPYLIFGTSTWEIGAMQEDWEVFMETVDKADLGGKKVALFGLGDQEVYEDSFADGVARIYKKIKDRTTIVGKWNKDDYLYTESEAREGDHFIGLIIDEDNQHGLTGERVKVWVEQLKKEFK